MVPAITLKFETIETQQGFDTISIIEAEDINTNNESYKIQREIDYHIERINILRNRLWEMTLMKNSPTTHLRISSEISVNKSTNTPTNHPSHSPTNQPSHSPTEQPTTHSPTNQPTTSPTSQPTQRPTKRTKRPTQRPTSKPTKLPTNDPTKRPTEIPTNSPTNLPTVQWDSIDTSSSAKGGQSQRRSARIDIEKQKRQEGKFEDELLDKINVDKVNIFLDETGYHINDLQDEMYNNPQNSLILTLFPYPEEMIGKAVKYYSNIDHAFWVGQLFLSKLYFYDKLVQPQHNMIKEFLTESCESLAHVNNTIAQTIFSWLNKLYPDPMLHANERSFILALIKLYNEIKKLGEWSEIMPIPDFGGNYQLNTKIFFEYFGKYMTTIAQSKLYEARNHQYVFPLQNFTEEMNVLVSECTKWYIHPDTGDRGYLQEISNELYRQCGALTFHKSDYDIADIIHGWRTRGGKGIVAVVVRMYPMMLHQFLLQMGYDKDNIKLWKANWKKENDKPPSRRRAKKAKESKFIYTLVPLRNNDDPDEVDV